MERTHGKCWRFQLCPTSVSACSEPALKLQLPSALLMTGMWGVSWAGREERRCLAGWFVVEDAKLLHLVWLTGMALNPLWCWQYSDGRDDGVSALD